MYDLYTNNPSKFLYKFVLIETTSESLYIS